MSDRLQDQVVRHVVEQGECLLSLAMSYGFADWRTLYDHPENARVREDRSDPTVLFPGDQVFIPDRHVKEEPGATEERHRFKRKCPRATLRIRLVDEEYQPLSSMRYTLDLDLERFEGHTDTNGVLTRNLPVDASRGTLTVCLGEEADAETVTFAIQIGHLDPVQKVTGLQARLNNLGFACGTVDGVLGSKTLAAMNAFQARHGLPESSSPTAETLERLKEVHGS